MNIKNSYLLLACLSLLAPSPLVRSMESNLQDKEAGEDTFKETESLDEFTKKNLRKKSNYPSLSDSEDEGSNESVNERQKKISQLINTYGLPKGDEHSGPESIREDNESGPSMVNHGHGYDAKGESIKNNGISVIEERDSHNKGRSKGRPSDPNLAHSRRAFDPTLSIMDEMLEGANKKYVLDNSFEESKEGEESDVSDKEDSHNKSRSKGRLSAHSRAFDPTLSIMDEMLEGAKQEKPSKKHAPSNFAKKIGKFHLFNVSEAPEGLEESLPDIISLSSEEDGELDGEFELLNEAQEGLGERNPDIISLSSEEDEGLEQGDGSE